MAFITAKKHTHTHTTNSFPPQSVLYAFSIHFARCARAEARISEAYRCHRYAGIGIILISAFLPHWLADLVCLAVITYYRLDFVSLTLHWINFNGIFNVHPTI